jgi:hypothetical protein
MAETVPQDLGRRLREADSDELLRLLKEHAPELDVAAAQQALRNPYLTGEGLAVLLQCQHLLKSYEMRRDLALDPRTPEAQAIRFVATLYWRDLVRVGRETRVKPTVRRSADTNLINRLPGLAEGEKIAIARTVGAGVLPHLRHDSSPRVTRALLENPRLTEGILAPLVNKSGTPPAVLEVIASDRRWVSRYTIRVGLSRNPATPLAVALRLLPTLQKLDLKAVASDLRLSAQRRQRARVLLGEGP